MAKGLDDLTRAMLYKQSCKEISKMETKLTALAKFSEKKR